MESVTEYFRKDYTLTALELSHVCNITVQGVSKQIKKLDLKTEIKGSRNYLPPEEVRKLIESRGYVYEGCKILVSSIVKGGVGKSALTIMLSEKLSQLGCRVLIIDIDQQANTSQHFLGEPSELNRYATMAEIISGEANFKDSIVKFSPHIHILPSSMNNSILDFLFTTKNIPLDKAYKTMINSVEQDYDIIIFDTPPAITKPVLSAYLISSGRGEILAPVNGDLYSYEGLGYVADTVEDLCRTYELEGEKAIVLRCCFNKFSERKSNNTQFLAKFLTDPRFKNKFYKTLIKESQDVVYSINSSKSLFETSKKMAVKEDIDSLAREIIGLDGLSGTEN
jgi:chromosome partitioning protein